MLCALVHSTQSKGTYGALTGASRADTGARGQSRAAALKGRILRSSSQRHHQALTGSTHPGEISLSEAQKHGGKVLEGRIYPYVSTLCKALPPQRGADSSRLASSHMHTHIYTCTCTHAHTHAHARAHTHVHMDMDMHMHSIMSTCECTWVDVFIYMQRHFINEGGAERATLDSSSYRSQFVPRVPIACP